MYTVLVATLRTRSSPRPPLERSGRRCVLCSALSLYTGSPCFGVRGVPRLGVAFSTRYICVVHVIVFLHNIINLYCAFSDFENSIGLLVCVKTINLWSTFASSARVACRVLKMGSRGKLLLALIFTFATKGEFYSVTRYSVCVRYVSTILTRVNKQSYCM